jgi:hypothetical protein
MIRFVAPTPPTDAELDVMIRARLAAIGIDLDQLPPGTTPDPVTGTPGRDSVLASLRSFMRGTVNTLAGYEAGPEQAPMLYPSISTAWRSS